MLHVSPNSHLRRLLPLLPPDLLQLRGRRASVAALEDGGSILTPHHQHIAAHPSYHLSSAILCSAPASDSRSSSSAVLPPPVILLKAYSFSSPSSPSPPFLLLSSPPPLFRSSLMPPAAPTPSDARTCRFSSSASNSFGITLARMGICGLRENRGRKEEKRGGEEERRNGGEEEERSNGGEEEERRTGYKLER
eukprot:762846-Hanusia_phi.AAC.5